MAYVPGYSVTMRKDKRTGEHLAVVSSAYTNRHGERYYMAICESDGAWAELDPKYLTRSTVTVSNYPEWVKRSFDRWLGVIAHVAPRLYR